MKKTLLLTAACSLIFGSAAAGEIETAQRYTAPSVSVELTTVAVQGNAAVSEQTEIGQNMMAGSSAEVQELGGVGGGIPGSIAPPPFFVVKDKAEVQELGIFIEPPRNSAEVQELGGTITTTMEKAEVRELGPSYVDPSKNSAEVQELGYGYFEARDKAEVQELGTIVVEPVKNSAEVQDLGLANIAPRDKAEVRELGGGQVHPMRSNSTEVQELGNARPGECYSR